MIEFGHQCDVNLLRGVSPKGIPLAELPSNPKYILYMGSLKSPISRHCHAELVSVSAEHESPRDPELNSG
jgi:hypothetical protein